MYAVHSDAASTSLFSVENLPLIEKETLIAQRRDEQVARERKAQLAGMVAAQQGQASRTKKKAAKKSSIKKKKAVRRKKAADSDMDEGDSDEDEESEDDDEEEEEESDDDPAPGRKGARVRKSVGTSATRSSKLQELSENRKKKAAAKSRARAARGAGDSDDDDEGGRRRKASSSGSDDESDESSAYVDSDEERDLRRTGRLSKGKASGSRRRAAEEGPFVPPELEDINRARIGRDDILRIMYLRGWEDKLIGQFVRVNLGPQRDERTGRTTQRYRCYEVVDVKQGPRWYRVDEGKYTNVVLVLQFAKEKHTRDLSILSNSPVTQEEWERYSQAASVAPYRPSKKQVRDQAEEWADFVNYICEWARWRG